MTAVTVGTVNTDIPVNVISAQRNGIDLLPGTSISWVKEATCTYTDGNTATATVIADARIAATFLKGLSTLNAIGLLGVGGVVRINFSFTCPRVNGASALLDRIDWDPELKNNNTYYSFAAASIISTNLMLLLLCLLLVWKML